MEHQGPVSNEAEFECWLASAFENERERLQNRDRAAAHDAQRDPATGPATGEPKKTRK